MSQPGQIPCGGYCELIPDGMGNIKIVYHCVPANSTIRCACSGFLKGKPSQISAEELEQVVEEAYKEGRLLQEPGPGVATHQIGCVQVPR